MREIKRIGVDQIKPDPEQPRKHFDESALMDLGRNMLARGQLVPLIVLWCQTLKQFLLLDGERRWRAACLLGIKELDAIVFAERLTPAALRLLQLSIAVHRAELSLMERSDALATIQKEEKIGVGELAERVNLNQSVVTKLLGYQNGCPELKQLLGDCKIDSEKAYQICREPNLDKQRELLKEAPLRSRDEIRRKVNGTSNAPEAKVSSARFAMPGNATVSVQSPDLTLTLATEILSETLRILKKGLGQGLDITTQQRVMKDTVRSTNR